MQNMVMQNMYFINTNNQLNGNNRHANKQLVNFENWCLYSKCYQVFRKSLTSLICEVT